MTELTPEIIAVVEELNWDADLKQDFYVQMLEGKGPQNGFGSDAHIRSFANAFYANLRKNKVKVEKRRREIETESVDYITSALGLVDEGCDPMDQMIAEEEITSKLKELSPLLRATLERVVIGGERPEDLAVEEGTSANVIYQRVHKAREILRGVDNE